MAITRKLAGLEAVRAVGMLEFDQNLEVDCQDAEPERLRSQLLGRYRNMGLLIVVYPGGVLYVERPRPEHT